jgi:hypothetical protein
MKRVWRSMGLFIAFAIIALLGAMAYVRLAPSDPAKWHVDLEKNRPAVMSFTLMPPGTDMVRSLTGGAYADLFSTSETAIDLLKKLDAVASATPRTTRLAGSVEDGRITWITRSALWGFPDYTTAELGPKGLILYSRLRFGDSDMGVNAARLARWLAALSKS